MCCRPVDSHYVAPQVSSRDGKELTMIPRIASEVAMTAATALALSAAAAIAAQAPASASTFTATYSCSIPIVGTESVTVDGALTASPNPATAASPVGFDLSVA